MSLLAQRGNLISSRGTRGDCFVVPPRNDIGQTWVAVAKHLLFNKHVEEDPSYLRMTTFKKGLIKQKSQNSIPAGSEFWL
jgi:hypothetical protein